MGRDLGAGMFAANANTVLRHEAVAVAGVGDHAHTLQSDRNLMKESPCLLLRVLRLKSRGIGIGCETSGDLVALVKALMEAWQRLRHTARPLPLVLDDSYPLSESGDNQLQWPQTRC